MHFTVLEVRRCTLILQSRTLYRCGLMPLPWQLVRQVWHNRSSLGLIVELAEDLVAIRSGMNSQVEGHDWQLIPMERH